MMTDKGLSDVYFQNDEIDLIEYLRVVWQGKWLIIFITALFAVCTVIFALNLPNFYRATVLLSPVNDSNNSNSALLGQLGGLASLAGLNLGNASNSSSTTKNLAIMESRAFITDFINNYGLTVPIMASIPVDGRGTVEIDPAIYDETSGEWVREPTRNRGVVPSDWEVFEAFNEMYMIDVDTETGLVYVSIEWLDPVQVKNWLEFLVSDLNERIRQRDLEEAQKAIAYLEDQLNKTQLVDMRNVFYNLIEQQTQTIMLADVRSEYAFQVIDPAVIPEDKVSPNRAVICAFGTFLGFLVSSFVLIFISHIRKIRS